MNCTLEQIANKIRQSHKIAIFTHMRPDGDAFGSAMSLSYALKKLGKDSEVFVEGGAVPSNLAFVEGFHEIKKCPETQNYDLLVCVD